MMLQAEHVTVRYGELAAVSDVSLRIGEGEWWTVIGPNGAGKSTLAGALSRSLPWEGTITLNGRDIRTCSSAEYARSVGVLNQNHDAVYGFTVEEVVSLGGYARQRGFFRKGDPEGDEKIAEALALTGLEEMRNRNMLTLSGGERQRAFLAQVFCQDPEILMLDEPANHLDLPFQKELFSLIGTWLETPGRAVVTVMHDLSLARKYGTHALLMDRGRCVAQGKASEVLAPGILREVYGMDVRGWMLELLGLWKD